MLGDGITHPIVADKLDQYTVLSSSGGSVIIMLILNEITIMATATWTTYLMASGLDLEQHSDQFAGSNGSATGFCSGVSMFIYILCIYILLVC